MSSKAQKNSRKRGRPFANKDLSVVLDAAAQVFSKKGFDGAQIKDISEQANFSTSLLHYHFKNKEDLWKQTVRKLGDELRRVLQNIESYFKDLSGIPLLKAYNRQFIYFSAKHPEFFKIVFHEIVNESHRAEWLMDEILDPLHAQFSSRVEMDKNQNSAILPDSTKAHVHSMVVGAANIFFALSFQFKRQFGIDSFDTEEIEKYIDFVNSTLFAKYE